MREDLTTIDLLAFSGMFVMVMLLVIRLFDIWVHILYFEHGFSNFILQKKYLNKYYLVRIIHCLVLLIGCLACIIWIL